MADNKRVIVDPNKFQPTEEHHKNAEAYVLSNFMPYVNHAIQSLRQAGKIPHDVSNSDLHEVAVHGMMKAIDGFDPGRETKLGSFIHASIKGAIQNHLKPKDIAESVAAKIPRGEASAPGQQYMHVSSGSTGRQIAETMGGSIDEEGGEGGGYGTTASSAAMLSQRLTPEQRQVMEAKVKAHDERKAKLAQMQAPKPEPTPTPSTPAAPMDATPTNVGEVKEIAPGKKIAVRRAIDHSASAGEDTKLRHLAVDQAKNGGTK
jgi:DNA-directed RNA polymerase specialized sigma subunit